MLAKPSRMTAATGLAALLALGVAVPAATPAYAGRTLNVGGSVPSGPVDVVVRAETPAAAAAARALVVKAGGTVKRDLGVIQGFAASMPARALADLRRVAGVKVTVDAPVRMKSDDRSWLNQVGTTLLAPVIKAAGGDKADKADPDVTTGPTGTVVTGAGIGVALIDSGVAPVQGLNGAGKVVNGPDLSFESQVPALRYLDTYGHGTHMAGIIAGQDPSTVTGTARFDGVAPGARIISLKVASAEGASDVSQVIAAIDWVVAHRNDAGLNIRVLNLSFGTQSTQSAALDPLSFAVEQAWDKGIVVVVAAGNDGNGTTSLTMPAANPDVIAVGAADPKGTEQRGDDTVADFSNGGSVFRHADVLAAGRSVVSLRNPGSYIDQKYPGARVSTTIDPAQRFFRGSGTSQAAAVVSGSVALLLQQRPNLTPDQVKKLLMGTATTIPGASDLLAGAGQIDIARAATTKTTLSFSQLNAPSSGLGSLDKSRGGAYVYDSANGTALTGEKDIFGKAWSPLSWTLASRTQRSWSGGTWNGSTWTGSAYGTSTYSQKSWTGTTWTGRSWSGANWSGRSWTSAVWSGRSWTSQTWTGRSWTGRSWTSAGWSGAPWQ